MKNQENNTYWFFIKLEKLHFGSIWPKQTLNKIFSKNPALSLFEIDDSLASCKKSENFYSPFQRKTPEKQREMNKWSNRHTDRELHRTFPSWVQLDTKSLSVIRQKGESFKFSEKTNISNPLIRTRTCTYQGVRNVRFFGKSDVFCFLETPVLRFTLLPYYRRVQPVLRY